MSVGSQRNLSNNFIVDGLSANDDAAGLSGITYGVDAVEQFQVVTSGAQAELGRALGGYVNVVTKSGANAAPRHALRLRARRWLNARTRCWEPSCRWTSRSTGGSLGGPLVANRTFYFSNVEQRRLDQTGLTTDLRRQRRRDQRADLRRLATADRGRNRRVSESGRYDPLPRRRSTTRSAAAIRSAPLQPVRRRGSRIHAAPAASMHRPRRRDSPTSTSRLPSATR